MPTVFIKGGTTVNISRGPVFPYSPEPDKYQIIGKTDGGTVIIQELGAQDSQVTFQFQRLTTAERDDLFDFWDDDIDGAFETFTFTITDHGGATIETHTARWMNKFLFKQIYANRWDGEIELRYE